METLPLEFAGYRPGQKLGGIALEYESSMVSDTNFPQVKGCSAVSLSSMTAKIISSPYVFEDK